MQGNDLDIAGRTGDQSAMNENFSIDAQLAHGLCCPSELARLRISTGRDFDAHHMAGIADDEVDLQILVETAEAERSVVGPGQVSQVAEDRCLEHASADVGNPEWIRVRRKGGDEPVVAGENLGLGSKLRVCLGSDRPVPIERGNQAGSSSTDSQSATDFRFASRSSARLA